MMKSHSSLCYSILLLLIALTLLSHPSEAYTVKKQVKFQRSMFSGMSSSYTWDDSQLTSLKIQLSGVSQVNYGFTVDKQQVKQGTTSDTQVTLLEYSTSGKRSSVELSLSCYSASCSGQKLDVQIDYVYDRSNWVIVIPIVLVLLVVLCIVGCVIGVVFLLRNRRAKYANESAGLLGESSTMGTPY